MNRKEEEKILNEKLEIIRRQISALEREYNDLYSYTISRREDLRQERSNLKFNEVSSELKKINKKISQCNAINTKIKKLKISERSPYFACVNFDDDTFYLGKLGVKDESGLVVINDWRAPVANLYYNFETGPAFYMTPENEKIEGIIKNKKQYKIEKSNLVYCFETKVEVVDEILQRTLAENSSEHMKTIVASIQKEQNKIIRESSDKTIIVQGVAGSGKTSIALHRLAYLLYNNKDAKNKKTYILSPNKVFSNYISTVLPELGEKKSQDISLDEILNETFGDLISFSSKFEDVENFLKNEKKFELHKRKTSYDFYTNLKNYLASYFENIIEFKDVTIKKSSFEKEKIEKVFENTTGKTFFDKINQTANVLIDLINIQTPLSFGEENSIKHLLTLKLLAGIDKNHKNILSIYKNFLKSQNITLNGNKLSFDDAVNLLFIKNYIFGADKKLNAVHLVIDELQDYSPVALDVISQTFDCTKTALGDLYQKIDGTPDDNYPKIASQILNSDGEIYYLTKVYRSTKEIAQFSSDILEIKDIHFVSRAGEMVEINKTNNLEADLQNQIEKLKEKYKNIAVITKTYAQSCEIAKKLGIKIISPISQRYKTGVITTPAYLAKGLEFDAVIILDASESNYNSSLDAQQLYVAATRPLHKLIVNYSGELTHFIKK